MKSKPTILSLSLALLVGGSTFAFKTPDDTALRQKTYTAPELYIASATLQEDEVVSRGRSADLVNLSAFGVEQGGAMMDPRSGRWGTLIARAPMIPGVGNELKWADVGGRSPADVQELEDTAWASYRGWLSANSAELQVDMAELGTPTVTAHRGGELVQIYVPRYKDGVRVDGSSLHAVISHGNLVLWGAIKWGDIDTPSSATLSKEAALEVARGHVGEAGRSLQWGKKELLYVPTAAGADPRTVEIAEGYGYRLAWSLKASALTEAGEWEALVDAQGGELLAFRDVASYAAEPEVYSRGVLNTREVVGGVYPVSNDGVGDDGMEQTYPMPFAYVSAGGQTYTTDGGGNVPVCLDTTLSTNLDGPYVDLTDNCGLLDESSAGTTLDLGTSGGIDCTTAGTGSPGNTHASRSGFYEINRSIEMGRSYLPDNSWLQGQLPVEMNIPITCNATGGPGGLRFYQSGGGCSNTGELAGVFVHEWGHGMDGADATPGISSPGEGIADIYASLRLHDSCMGRNFRVTPCGGYGDPCTECTGVRDIDYAKRNSGVPHDIAFIDSACQFTTGAPCGGSVHCEGAVYAEAVWDLWNRDLVGGPWNMDPETAYRLATRLTFEGAGAVGTWYNCINGAGTGDGCNADGGYLNYIAADDDDGNLNNGTPHMAAIDQAFGNHGISCGTPTVQDSGCANTPAVAPTVMATALDRGAKLTWNAVANAAAYRVYRGEGVHSCDFGKEYLGETTDLEWVDHGLQNGTEYYYVVVPIGAAGSICMGPSSSCAAVTATAGPNFGYDSTSVAAVTSTGDMDDFVDSCEETTLSFDVENFGTGTLTNARVVGVTSPSHPGIDFTIGGLATFDASLTACETSSASFTFQAVDIAFGDTIDFDVEITADELDPMTRTFRVSLDNVESDFQNFASKTFDFESGTDGWQVESGTFTRSNAIGGADGTMAMNSSTLLDNQCDRMRSPLFKPAANTDMVMWTNYDIEPGPTWYDRANVATIAAGSRSLITPDGGRGYDTDSSAYGGCNSGEMGWAHTNDTWAFSSWSAAALDAGALAGQEVQLQVTYSTDGGLPLRGFGFDRVILTNVDVQVEDVQADCFILPLFLDGFESGDTSEWSSSLGGM